MTRRGQHFLFLMAIVFTAAPLFAQQNTDRITKLEKRVDDLTNEIAQIRQEIATLKGAAAPAPVPTGTQTEDLTKVEPVASSAAPPAPATAANEQPQTALTDVQTVNNVANPGAAKALNPDISAIGNFIGKAGMKNPYEYGSGNERDPFRLDEAELAFQAYVDPYAKANFFLSASPEGLDIEEAYAQFVTLPYGLTARAGKFKAMFGKANTWHTHVRPWVDQPLMIHNFFTDDQLADSGIEVSKALPTSWAFMEATGEVFAGNNNVYQRVNHNDLFYDGHFRLFKDITENSNIEVGTSYARGTLGNSPVRPGATSQFGGIDITYRWKPLIRSTYNSMILRFEGLVNDRGDVDRRLKGFYTSFDYQIAQRWFAGLRLDDADRVGIETTVGSNGFSRFNDKGESATLTFWPSEFSQIRGQLRHTSYGGAKSVTELLMQLQFSIGAHGAHTF
jgi:hypothetical protein